MAQDTALLRYLLKGARRAPGSGSQRDLAFEFDGTDDYISSNATIGRTGYDMNVSGNVSTGSDGDGSYIQFNGSRNAGVGTVAQCAISSGVVFNQGTSFSIGGKFKVNSYAPTTVSGLFGSNFDVGVHYTTTNTLVFGLRGSATVQNTYSTSFTLGTSFYVHLIYDAPTTKFYCYINGALQNAGGTTGPATFATLDWILGDTAITGGVQESSNKFAYHAAIRNKALTQAEIDADIALGNTAKNDPSIVAYYIPDNLTYNTQYGLNPKALDQSNWIKTGATTVTADTTVAPDGTTTADTLAISGTASQGCTTVVTSISGAAIASKTFIVKAFVKVAAGTSLFRLECSHNGVATYNSSDQTATTTRQEFTFTQTFTSATGGTGITYGIDNSSGATNPTLQVRNVRLFLVNETLRDESPNIGGYIGWKTQKVLSCRYKPAADFADSPTAGALMVIPRAYMHDRSTDHRPQIRYDDRVSARTSIATPLGVGFRGKVHVLGMIYRTGSAFATKFYTNGVLVDSDTGVAIPASSFIQSILESGRRSTAYFSGNIRDSRIYTFTGSFTDADALAIYNGGEPSSAGVTKYLHYKPPVGEVGTTTQDQSTNDRDGTLNGGVTRDYI